MKEIVQEPHPALHAVSQQVTDVTATPVQQVITDLQESLASQADGVGLSAPQIAENVRIFVVSPITYGPDADPALPTVFVNPVLTHTSDDHEIGEEGCLSIRGVYGNVSRPTSITVNAMDQHGNEFTLDMSGFPARVVQHEIDHLDGILFTEKATDVRTITDEELQAIQSGTHHEQL